MMMFKAALFTAVVTLLGSAFALPYQQEVELAVRYAFTLLLRVQDTKCLLFW